MFSQRQSRGGAGRSSTENQHVVAKGFFLPIQRGDLACSQAAQFCRRGFYVAGSSCLTAIQEHTTPAGAVPPLPLECGIVRTIEPTIAIR